MRILVIEDERPTAELLCEFIESHAENKVVRQLPSVEEAVLYLSENQRDIDLIFMDIQLSDGLAFEVFRHMEVVRPVVFCTAYDDYFLEAFKNNGIDYILKPFREKDIHLALQKFDLLHQSFRHREQHGKVAKLQGKKPAETLLVPFRQRVLLIAVLDIAYFLLENETVNLFNKRNEKFHFFQTMDALQGELDERLFFRINRQALVNRHFITSIEPYLNRKLVVNLAVPTPEKLIVSRLKVTDFKQWLAT